LRHIPVVKRVSVKFTALNQVRLRQILRPRRALE